jgi:adenylylsulfate kinase
MNSSNKNIQWQQTNITKEMRQLMHGHKSFVLWFTGLSGSGKSTIASEIEQLLFQKGMSTYLLDGDNIRHGLNDDLSFNEQDRKENIRRIGEVAKLFVDSGIIVLVAAISPIDEVRKQVREKFDAQEYVEIFVDCSINECEKRDPKGLYKKVRDGLIQNFTGIATPYEAPSGSEIVVNTETNNIDECTELIMNYLTKNQYIK